MKEILREHIWLFLIAAIYCILALFILNVYHPEINIKFFSALMLLSRILSIALSFVLGVKANYILFVMPKEKRSELFHNLLEQTGYTAIAAIALAPSFIFFAYLKQTVLTSYPEILDEKLAAIDHFIHFGTDPWIIAHSSITYPILIFFIAFFYNKWIHVMYTFSAFQASYTSHKFERMQYLITFLLAWTLLGNLVAYFGASMGPCFFEKATDIPHENFSLLIEKLKNSNFIDVRAHISIQDALWDNFINKKHKLGYSISAMPSIHVAVSFLMYLSARTIGIKSRIISFMFFISTMIGSVMFGWHYAIDGYVSIIGIYIIWKTVGWALKKDPIYKEYYEMEKAENSVSN